MGTIITNFLHGLSESELKAIAAFAQAVGTVGSALIVGVAGVLITGLFNRRRDREQREAWWRGHALELTKLDMERVLKTRSPRSAEPQRPGVLDFLANYRDLQELGRMTPAELYARIREKRINEPDEVPEVSVTWRKELLQMLSAHPDPDALIALWRSAIPEDREWLEGIRGKSPGEKRVSQWPLGLLSVMLGIAVGLVLRRHSRP